MLKLELIENPILVKKGFGVTALQPKKETLKKAKLRLLFLTEKPCIAFSRDFLDCYEVITLKNYSYIHDVIRFKKVDLVFVDAGLPNDQALTFLSHRSHSLRSMPTLIWNEFYVPMEPYIAAGANDFYVGLTDSPLFWLRVDNFARQALQSPWLEINRFGPVHQKQSKTELAFLAYYDSLTGLPNRRFFKDRLEEKVCSLGLAAAEHKKFAVLFLDLDGFKAINDDYQHTVGDWLLKQVASRLKNCMRKNDTVSRLGGDEFAVILDGVGRESVVETIAHRILCRLSSPYVYEGYSLKIGVSIGISLFPVNGETYDDLISHADYAMYLAKKSGKGKFCFMGMRR
ncbi:MAG: GGDEF domain-containing protein [Alphaproteobacteria bacterium]|nr:GGDEF domain-containing protein [Alphaproteobacteria bacterium]